MNQLNSDLLRTFLAVAETGSMTDGAARIFRSQSATSLQIGKLEELLGQPVFDRHGRGVTLTATGERLLPVAHDVTRTLSSAMRELTSDGLNGKLRLGIPDDQNQQMLAQIIGEFAQSHPLVELEVSCALSAGFPAAIACGDMDIAVYEVEQAGSDHEVLRTEKTFWMMSRHHDLLQRDPLPVALFDRECWWRDAALAALQASGRRFRIVYSSQSVTGVAAAIEAGVAIGLLGQSSLNNNLKCLDATHGFAAMPTSKLVLGTRSGADDAPVQAMKSAIRQAFAAS
ncbi:MAG: LysR substrate-binding domain-containing protein [Pseudomonadota bacterium]